MLSGGIDPGLPFDEKSEYQVFKHATYQHAQD